MPTPTAIDLARRFRRDLLDNEAAAAERMARSYARIATSLQADIAALAQDIAKMAEPSKDDLIALGRMQRILNQVQDQAARFGSIVQNEAANISSQAIERGVADALAMVDASLPQLPGNLRAQLTASLTRLPAEAIEAAVGLVSDDSPLTAKLSDAYGEYVAGQVRDAIVIGIGKGQNPRTIAGLLNRNLTVGLGQGLTSALTTVRTAQIKSYQIANHMAYAANERIVPAWTWVAALDNRPPVSSYPCMSCIAKHGTTYPVTETLNDHHNGRCVPVPVTISYRALGLNIDDPVEPFVGGAEWFKQQPEAVQVEMMGPGRYELWRQGGFDFRELSTPYKDEVYGELIRETTLAELSK